MPPKNISEPQGGLLSERQKLRYGLGGAYIGEAPILETIRYTLLYLEHHASITVVVPAVLTPIILSAKEMKIS